MNNNDPEEYTEAGQPVYRHMPPDRVRKDPDMSDSSMEEVCKHMESMFGETRMVYHEIVSDIIHLDVHHIAPTVDQPFHLLYTTGMSDKPMNAPDADSRFAELMIALSPDWSIAKDSFADERNYWPIRWLKTCAHMVHEYDTWLGYGHTVPNGEPPEPFAVNTKLCCILVEIPILMDVDKAILTVRGGKKICFWHLIPIYEEEMSLKLAKGTEALEDLFDKHKIAPIVTPRRRNVAKKRFGIL